MGAAARGPHKSKAERRAERRRKKHERKEAAAKKRHAKQQLINLNFYHPEHSSSE